MGDSKKIRYLVSSTKKKVNVSVVDRCEGRTRNSIILIPFDALIALYEGRRAYKPCYVKIEWQEWLTKDIIGEQYYLRCWSSRFSLLHNKAMKAYMDKDVVRLKQIIFGDLLNDNIEIFFDEAILGTRLDGVTLKVACDNKGQFLFERVRNNNLDGCDADSFKLKLNMSETLADSVVAYDCGKFFHALNHGQEVPCSCAGIRSQWGSDIIVNKTFNNAFFEVGNLRNSNIKVNNLVHSLISGLAETRLEVDIALFTEIYQSYGSTIKIKSARNITFGQITDCVVEIGSVFNLKIESDIHNSKIIFNENIDNDSFNLLGGWWGCGNTEFIFKKYIGSNILRKLIQYLRDARYREASFKMYVNDKVYAECKEKMPGRYMKYIMNNGE